LENNGCLPLRAEDRFLPQLDRYRAASVNVVSVNAGFGNMSWAEHLRVLSFMRRWLALRPADYRLVATVEDLHLCSSDGKLGAHFNGARVTTLAHIKFLRPGVGSF
jgi:membrane dipeptidase